MPRRVQLDRLTAHEAKEYLAAGQFPPGSMGTKIQAAIEFLLGVRRKQTRSAIITDHEHLRAALIGKVVFNVLRNRPIRRSALRRCATN